MSLSQPTFISINNSCFTNFNPIFVGGWGNLQHYENVDLPQIWEPVDVSWQEEVKAEFPTAHLQHPEKKKK